MPKYLSSNEDININLAKFIAKVQCYMLEECKSNYKEMYKNNTMCDVCKLHECTQKHLLLCPKLLEENELVTEIPIYENIFKDDIKEQKYVAEIMMENLRIKQCILKDSIL